ncbi:MAG: hypothetical protein K0R28_1542 [Paenibacillus sp.]|jgi:hypothetical protein|nr:hypothetical protein [Paenibacillus sp.]
MINIRFSKTAIKIMLAFCMLTGVSVFQDSRITQASQVQQMDCYQWFDFYYKVSGDLDSSYYAYQGCLRVGAKNYY